jgi:hypothetical protein
MNVCSRILFSHPLQDRLPSLCQWSNLLGVVQCFQSRSTPLAADASPAAPDLLPAPHSFSGGPTSPRNTRVGGSRCSPSGRTSRRGRVRPMFTPGSRACAYKTASGRGEWPNRDPIDEQGFEALSDPGESSDIIPPDGANLYTYVINAPTSWVDPLGLACAKPGVGDPRARASRRRAQRKCEGQGGRWVHQYEKDGYQSLQACLDAHPLCGLFSTPGGSASLGVGASAAAGGAVGALSRTAAGAGMGARTGTLLGGIIGAGIGLTVPPITDAIAEGNCCAMTCDMLPIGPLD